MAALGFWIVIYGENAPAGEVANAKNLASQLGPFAWALPSNAFALGFLASFCHVIVLGGPLANPYAVTFNNNCNPNYGITVNRAQDPGESWQDYVASGSITVQGFVKNGTAYPGGKNGIIGVGTGILGVQQVILIGGWNFQDTCAEVQAYLANSGPGVYQNTWTSESTDTCDANASYQQVTDPLNTA